MHSPRTRRLAVEPLEDRTMFAVGMLDNGWLGILGTKSNDRIEIAMDNGAIVISDNGYIHWSAPVDTIAVLCLAGNDQILVDESVTIPVWIDAGKGHDLIVCGSGPDAVSAGAGNDLIIGGQGNDILFGDAGNDHIFGDEGYDVISGGKGSDEIWGGDDDDVISGDAGNDEIHGELGDDVLDGAAGKDLLSGDEGDDELMGGAGVDFLYGGLDIDNIDGGAGKDFCFGGDGDDQIKGGAGADRLDGEAGFNLLDKDQGKDLLFNGIETDLDLQLVADLRGFQYGGGTAHYRRVNENGILKSRFSVELTGVTPNASIQVTIGSTVVGQVETDASGNGELNFSTDPQGNELPFPVNFPGINAGTMIYLGSANGSFVRPYFYTRPISLPAVP